jgi:hypothetical protein
LETKGEEHQKSIRENLKHNGYRFKQIWLFNILFIKNLESKVYNGRHNYRRNYKEGRRWKEDYLHS